METLARETRWRTMRMGPSTWLRWRVGPSEIRCHSGTKPLELRGIRMPNPALSPASLSPAMFSVVLGTGGLSLAANLLGLRGVALALFWLNIALLIVAWAATVLRGAWGFRALLDDFTHPGRGPAFFLAVLATSIFGLQVAALTDARALVFGLWIFAAVLWAIMSCGFVVGVTIRDDKPAFETVISPGWFLPGAALEATVGLGTHATAETSGVVAVLLSGGFLLGLFFNLLVMAAVLYRWIFFPMKADQLVATNWINMGAFAIIVVAGVKLKAPNLAPLILLSWTMATWWLPILFAVGFWRHVLRRVPLRYDAQYWPVVFSPVVYASATFHLAESFQLPSLHLIPPLFFGFAAAVWTALMVGLVRSWLRAN